MFQCTVRIITVAACIFIAANLQASSSTAYVSVCCNAPSTAGVFNASTLTQARSIVTGSGGDGLALSPDGTKMFVTVDHKRELQVISTATGTILATVKVPISVSGEPPIEVAISPDGSHVYVFVPQDMPASLVLAVDTTTYLVTRSATLPFNESLGPLLISPDGTQLYLEEGLVNEYIQVIDTATLKPVTQIPVNESPSGICVTPSGLILMTDTSNELLVINPKTATIVNRFSLSSSTQILTGVVISSPDSTTAYIAFAGNSILAVNISNGAIIYEAPVGYLPSQFAISPGGQWLYSIDYSSTAALSIAEFNTQSHKTVAAVRQLGPLSSLALTQDGNTLYVLNADVSAIVPVDVSTQTPGPVTLGGIGLNSLAIPPNGGTIWASSYAFAAGGDIVVLDPATGHSNFFVGPTGGLSFDPSGSVLYVANPGEIVALDVSSGKQISKRLAGNLENIGQAIPSPDGKNIYISLTFVSGAPLGNEFLPPGEILVLDTSTFKVTSIINIPDGLGVIALTADGSTLVCTSNKGQVRVISTATNTITATIDVTPSSGALEGLALSSDGSTAYITDAENNLLFVASLATDMQTATIPVGKAPLTVAITPDGSQAWVLTNEGLDIVTLASSQVSGPVQLPGTPSAIVFAP